MRLRPRLRPFAWLFLAFIIAGSQAGRAHQNDAFADRLDIDAASAVIVGSVGAATREPGEPSHAGTSGLRSIWWRWTPASDHQAQLSLVGANEEAVALAVYTGAALADLRLVASAQNRTDGTAPAGLAFAARAGMDYAICASLPEDAPADRLILALNQAPLFNIAAEHRVAAGDSISLTVSALHGPAAYSVSGLPPELSFDSVSGRISGVPRAPGEHWLDLTADNAFGQGAARVRLEIVPPSPPAAGAPFLAPPRTIHGVVGQSLPYVSPLSSNGQSAFSASGLPAGIHLHAGTGEISGAPSSAGIFETTVTATNAAGSFSSPVTFVIAASADAPVLRGPAVVELVLGETLSLSLSPSDSAATLSAASLPAGLSLDSALRRLVGTPVAAGRHDISVTAANAAGSTTARFTVLVHPAPVRPPEFTHNALWITELGIGSTLRLTATQAPSAFAVEELPSWAAFDAATATLSARPASLGVFPIRVTATNARGSTHGVVHLYVGTVTPPTFPVFFPGSLASLQVPLSVAGTVGSSFAYYIPASPGSGFYLNPFGSTSALTVEGLPPGLTFSQQTSQIMGTVNTAGDYPITIRYFVNGEMLEALVTLVFRPAAAPPPATPVDPATLITAPLALAARVGSSASHALVTPSADATFSVSGLPPGLGFSSSTGRITGTPTSAGSFPVDISVVNSLGTTQARVVLQIGAALAPEFSHYSPALSAIVGVSFTEYFHASNSPTSYACLGALPPGLVFKTTSGTLEGTPTVAGTYFLTIRATNAAGSDEIPFTLVVRPAEPAEIRFPAQLVLTQGVGTINSAYSSPAGATYVATGLPPGLVFSGTGTLSGAPTTPGDYDVTIHASRGGLSSLLRSQFRVLAASAQSELPVFTSAAGTHAVLGAPFAFRLEASHYPTAYTASPLPPGLTLDAATGLLGGTPTQAGDFHLTCTASNAKGATTSWLAIRVLPTAIAAPTFALPASTILTLGDQNASLDLHLGNSPASVSATGLPRGLAIDSAGVIAGVPRVPGVFPVTVHATNAAGSTAIAFDLEVRTSRYAPLPTLNTILSARVGRAFSQAVTYSLPGGEQPFEIEVLGLPSGLYFDSATKSITGIPQNVGTSELDILVRTVAYGGYARVRLIVAAAAPERPRFTSASTVLATINQPFSHQLQAVGEVSAFGASSLPAWLTLEPTTGLLSGTPTTQANHALLVTATNAQGTRVARLNIAARPAGATPPLLLDMPGSLVARIGESLRHEFSFAHSGNLDYIGNFTGQTNPGPPPSLSYTPFGSESPGVRTITIHSSGPGGAHVSQVALEIESPDTGGLVLHAPAALRALSASYVSQSFSASHPSATFTASGLPSGLSLTSWGNLSGSPVAFGEYLATITATVGEQQVSGTVLISVINAAAPPAPSPGAPALEYSVGEYVGFAPALPDTGSYYYGDLSYQATGLPPGLHFDPSRRHVLGTPTTPGTYTITVSVAASSSYYPPSYPLPPPARTVMIVRPAPLPPTHFTSPAEYRAILGLDFTASLAANHGPASFTASGLPPGLTLDPATGAITGRPSATGEHLVAVTAANSAGTASANVRFVILPGTPRPVIGGNLHVVAKAGASTGRSLGLANAPTATSATGLPPGLVLSASGGITGTPTTPGDYPVTITATNVGGSSTAGILVQVLPADLPDLLWPSIDLSFDAGANISNLLLSRGSGGPVLDFNAVGLPSGLFLDAPTPASSVYLKGRVDSPGRHAIRLDLSGYGQSLSLPAVVNVVAPAAPVLSTPAVHLVTAGQAFDYPLGAHSSVRLELPALPAGVLFNSSGRRLVGVIAAPGIHEIPLTAVSPSGQTTLRLTLIARPAGPATPSSVRPLLTSAAHFLGHVGAPVRHPLASANPDAVFSVEGLPAGLRYDATQRAIVGSPASAGRHLVTITAQAGGLSESATLLLTIRPYETRLASFLRDPRLSSNGLAYVGVPYSDASNTVQLPPGTWSYNGLPPGLDGQSEGGISGVPERAGDFDYTATLDLSPPLEFTRSFRVESAPRSLALPVHAAQADLLVGAPAAIAVGTSQPAALDVTGLPDGLSYSSAQHQIVGISNAPPGVYPVTITATNAHGSLASRLDLLLRPALEVPRFTSASIASATRHERFTYSAATRPAALVFSAEALPAGLSLDPATGRMSGRPTEAGDHIIHLTATNAAGSATLVLRLRVAPGLATEPPFTVPANSLWPLGTDRSLLLARPSTTALSVSSLPAGLALDSVERLVFGRLLSAGAYAPRLASGLGGASPRLIAREALLSPPWFVHEPEDLVVLAGRSARFRAIAEGRATPVLAWTVNGVAAPADADGTLVIASADASLDGVTVSATATNPSGRTTSRVARLSVLPAGSALGYAHWAAALGLPPEVRSPTQSPSPGAAPNLLAYAMDLAPGENVVLAPEFVALPFPVLRLTYRRAKYAADVTLTPQRSTDLTTWHDEGITTEMLSQNDHHEIWRATLPVSGPHTFLRLTAASRL